MQSDNSLKDIIKELDEKISAIQTEKFEKLPRLYDPHLSFAIESLMFLRKQLEQIAKDELDYEKFEDAIDVIFQIPLILPELLSYKTEHYGDKQKWDKESALEALAMDLLDRCIERYQYGHPMVIIVDKGHPQEIRGSRNAPCVLAPRRRISVSPDGSMRVEEVEARTPFLYIDSYQANDVQYWPIIAHEVAHIADPTTLKGLINASIGGDFLDCARIELYADLLAVEILGYPYLKMLYKCFDAKRAYKYDEGDEHPPMQHRIHRVTEQLKKRIKGFSSEKTILEAVSKLEDKWEEFKRKEGVYEPDDYSVILMNLGMEGADEMLKRKNYEPINNNEMKNVLVAVRSGVLQEDLNPTEIINSSALVDLIRMKWGESDIIQAMLNWRGKRLLG